MTFISHACAFLFPASRGFKMAEDDWAEITSKKSNKKERAQLENSYDDEPDFNDPNGYVDDISDDGLFLFHTKNVAPYGRRNNACSVHVCAHAYCHQELTFHYFQISHSVC